MKFGISPASLEWINGSPCSRSYGDIYFSKDNGLAESEFVFIEQNRLKELFASEHRFVICEIGFGTGLNFLLAWLHWARVSPPDAKLFYIGIEKHPLNADDIAKAVARWPELKELCRELLNKYPPLTAGFHCIQLAGGRVHLTLAFGDAGKTLPEVSGTVDHFNLDGFAPSKNPDLWSAEIFTAMADLSRPGTTFSTFTSAGFVRRGLEAVGFEVSKCAGYGDKRESLKGRFAKEERKKIARPVADRKAVIIGAGLSGTATAFALVKRGFQVALLERDKEIASGPSGNPSAVVMPYLQAIPDRRSRFYLSAFSFFLQHIKEIGTFCSDVDWQQSGALHLPAQDRVKKLMDNLDSLTFPQSLVSEVSAAEASDQSGMEIMTPALFYSLAGTLAPATLCHAYLGASKNLIRIKLNKKALAIEKSSHGYQVKDADNNIIAEAEIIVMANAYDCQSFNELSWLKVEAVKGQLCSIEVNQKTSGLTTTICANGHVTPAKDGVHFLGATYSHGDHSDTIDPLASQALLEKFSEWVPAFKDAGLREGSERVSHRTSSFDRIPYIGPVPDAQKVKASYNDRHFDPASEDLYHPGLYVSSGHGSRGAISCPFAGEILAAQVCDEPLPLEKELIQAIAPMRYLLRALGRGEC